MQICKVRLGSGEVRVGVVESNAIHVTKADMGAAALSAILHAANPTESARQAINKPVATIALAEAELLAPLDEQEVWAAGVTYKRSSQARQRESAGAATFYDKVYTAERPELFFKATPHRVVGPKGKVRIRRDSKWNVPEPELALVIAPDLRIVGYTIGNDMSSRDIEGENPLYLPQAKLYDHACALGPVITLAEAMPPLESVTIRLEILREGRLVFEGSTSVAQMKRTPRDLVNWLGRDNRFPGGVILLTGTGIIPPDEFTLAVNDCVTIEIAGIGRLVNEVEQI
jgi:2-dehydro-3-deoxy-D-arabinonate dehydratase